MLWAKLASARIPLRRQLVSARLQFFFPGNVRKAGCFAPHVAHFLALDLAAVCRSLIQWGVTSAGNHSNTPDFQRKYNMSSCFILCVHTYVVPYKLSLLFMLV
jgi:hypothetical protein